MKISVKELEQLTKKQLDRNSELASTCNNLHGQIFRLEQENKDLRLSLAILQNDLGLRYETNN